MQPLATRQPLPSFTLVRLAVLLGVQPLPAASHRYGNVPTF